MRHIYKNETGYFSAESAEEANRMLRELLGFDLEYVKLHDPFKEPPIDDEKILEVLFKDGAEDNRLYPAWVDSEPEAKVSDYRVPTFNHLFVKEVSAPARIWAKHMIGMVLRRSSEP